MGFGIVLRTALALVAVVALMYAFFFWLRRTYFGRRGTGRLLQVLDVAPLGSKALICALKVGDRVLIVGAGEGRVSLLCEIQGDEVANLPTKSEEFPGLLKAAIERFKAKA